MKLFPFLAMAVAGSLPALAVDQDLYKDVVAPILDNKCTDCHGETKQKGRLRLDTYAFIRKGGEDGPVVRAGDPQKSKLYRLLQLPLRDEDHMPPAKKTQMTAGEIAAIRWWIEKGAPEHLALGAAGAVPAPVQALLSGTEPGSPSAPSAVEPMAQSENQEPALKRQHGRKQEHEHEHEDEHEDAEKKNGD